MPGDGRLPSSNDILDNKKIRLRDYSEPFFYFLQPGFTDFFLILHYEIKRVSK